MRKVERMTEELKQCLRNVILHYMFCDQEDMEIAVSAVLASQGMGKPFKLLFNRIKSSTLTITVIFPGDDDSSKDFNIIIRTSTVDFSELGSMAKREFAEDIPDGPVSPA